MKPDHTTTFDPEAFTATVRGMKAKGESVHEAGRRVLQATGALHPHVDVRQNRVSHNAMVPDSADPTKFVLTNGVALPIISFFDGTGSTRRWLEQFFRAAQAQDARLAGARKRYNTQLATGMVQDVKDRTPVVQLSQFESDHRVAEQVRLLQPAGDGGDAAEDYDLGLAAALWIDADIWKHYRMKGYYTLVADEIGRGFVTPDLVRQHLGHELTIQGSKLSTADLAQQLLERWHVFFLQVPGTYDMLIPYTTDWWNDVLGKGRVISVPDPQILAEIRAGLVYVTEAQHPTQQGLAEFLQGGVDQSQQLNTATVSSVWRQLQAAEKYFGEQSKHPDYAVLPHPGAVFAHYRHAWPIDHPRAHENVTPTE